MRVLSPYNEADKRFAVYVNLPTRVNLLEWYQAEREVSPVLKEFSEMVDLAIDGHSRFVEQLARQAREGRTGLKYWQRLPLLRVAA